MLRKWFIYLHGLGAKHQADLHRCSSCGKIVTHNKIRAGDICCAGRVAPTNPTIFEKVRLLLLPWTI